MAIYMYVDKIPGSSSEKNHDGWIPIKTCEFPVNRLGVNTKPGKVTDRLRSNVVFPQITVTKDSDKASPNLMRWMVSGDPHEVKIAFCKEKGDPIMELTLKETLVVDLTASVTMDEQPTETLKLDFTKIEMSFFEYNAKNVQQPAQRVLYDLTTAQGG
jgi:type VI secretion system secreted protein Hcp